jgi:hypothetical protein
MISIEDILTGGLIFLITFYALWIDRVWTDRTPRQWKRNKK